MREAWELLPASIRDSMPRDARAEIEGILYPTVPESTAFGMYQSIPNKLEVSKEGLVEEEKSVEKQAVSQRYCLVSDDDGHHYVIEVEHRDEWYELDDSAINDGLAWAWLVGGAPNQVTFTDVEIFGDPIVEAPAAGKYEILTGKMTLEEAVFTALGAASVCWESMEGTGEFDSSRAKKIGEELLNRIKMRGDVE